MSSVASPPFVHHEQALTLRPDRWRRDRAARSLVDAIDRIRTEERHPCHSLQTPARNQDRGTRQHLEGAETSTLRRRQDTLEKPLLAVQPLALSAIVQHRLRSWLTPSALKSCPRGSQGMMTARPSISPRSSFAAMSLISPSSCRDVWRSTSPRSTSATSSWSSVYWPTSVP